MTMGTEPSFDAALLPAPIPGSGRARRPSGYDRIGADITYHAFGNRKTVENGTDNDWIA
jgi:hypothetical protein